MSVAATARIGLAVATGDDEGRLGAAPARRAMREALTRATGVADPVAAMRRVVAPSDVVGIKLNCLAGAALSPRPSLVEALVDLIVAAGVPPGRVIVFDRSSRELQRAGFELESAASEVRRVGIDRDWDREVSVSGAIGSCFARLVSTTCTALVSFGVVKDHDLAGVSAGMKNWYGVIHNPNKYHDHQCDPYVADVMSHPFVRSKLRLTVLDGVRAQCHGGPAFHPPGLFPLGTVVVSTDPVAADVWAWRVLDTERARRGLPSLEASGRPPRFIATAAARGLGVADPAAIREVGP